ncbi:MAG: hypothetical protein MZV70_56780 [Desulfobacterales bacterium]|nr:hypothetical protein [Desulfobacterales bacterium]
MYDRQDAHAGVPLPEPHLDQGDPSPMPDFSALFSTNANATMKASTIRELLKLTQKPDIISFAGGLPAPDVFPVADLKAAANVVFDTQASKALQYGTTEGDDGLEEELDQVRDQAGRIAEEGKPPRRVRQPAGPRHRSPSSSSIRATT